MKRALTSLSAAALLRSLVAGASCLVTACGLLPNEDEGDQEPQLGTFEIHVSPATATLKPGGSVQVIASYSCIPGANLPPECGTPGSGGSWVVTHNSLVSVVGDRTQNPATFYIHPAKAIDTELWFTVDFRPTNIPSKLKVTGRRRVDVQFEPTQLPAVREDISKEEPVLSSYPALLRVSSSTPTNLVVSIYYRGPETDLIDVSVVGPGAAQFSVAPPGLPFRIKSGQALFLPVNYVGQSQFGIQDNAVLVVITLNGASKRVDLVGSR